MTRYFPFKAASRVLSALLVTGALPGTLPAQGFDVLASPYNRPPGPVLVPLVAGSSFSHAHDGPSYIAATVPGREAESFLRAQFFHTATGPALAFVPDITLNSGAQLSCRVLAESPRRDHPGADREKVSWRRQDTAVEFLVGEKPVLAYHFDIVEPPEGITPLHRRSGFIHPLYSPAGAVLTDVSPPDHHHHYGIWHPWRQTVFKGDPLNFWELREAQGTVRFREFRRLWDGPVCGGFTARQQHVALREQEPAAPVLEEEFTVIVWNLGERDDPLWLIDYITRQRCATDSPLELPAYRYGGGFAFRGASGWNKETSTYLTSEGHTWENGDAQRSRWCRISGATDHGPASVLILSHPSNHAFPQPMRINPENYVFFNYTPIRDDAWVLEPGSDYVMRYRLIVANRILEAEEAETWWRAFAEPPRIFLHD